MHCLFSIFFCTFIFVRYIFKNKTLYYNMIPTDCSALCALAILKHSKSALFGLLSHVLAGPKVILFHASMKRMTFCPWYHHNILSMKVSIHSASLHKPPLQPLVPCCRKAGRLAQLPSVCLSVPLSLGHLLDYCSYVSAGPS